MNSPLEENEQAAFVHWLDIKGLKFTALTQDTYTRSWKQKARNKKLGVRPGFPDMCIIVPNGLAFVEMKRVKPKGRCTPAQKEWVEELNKIDNVECKVCWGADQAIEFINRFLPDA